MINGEPPPAIKAMGARKVPMMQPSQGSFILAALAKPVREAGRTAACRYFFNPAKAARISSSGSCTPINTMVLCGGSSPHGRSQSAL